MIYLANFNALSDSFSHSREVPEDILHIFPYILWVSDTSHIFAIYFLGFIPYIPMVRWCKMGDVDTLVLASACEIWMIFKAKTHAGHAKWACRFKVAGSYLCVPFFAVQKQTTSLETVLCALLVSGPALSMHFCFPSLALSQIST